MIEPNDDQHYSIFIQWSDEDQTYIASGPQLPGCVTHGDTYEEAVAHGREAIESWIAANRAWGHPIPPPRVLAQA